MENSEKIINWSIENSGKLSLKVEFYTGIQKYLKNIFDVGIFITINQREYYGRGSDQCESKAYLKAFSEVVERAALNIFNIDMTNGLAAHSLAIEARINARNELIERDAFMSKYLLSSGFRKIDYIHEGLDDSIKFEKININFYEMCRFRKGVGVLCILNGEESSLSFGNIMGTAYSEKMETASEKALIEALRSFSNLSNNKNNRSISVDIFRKIKEPSFLDHGNLSLDLDYSQKFNRMLDNSIISLTNDVVESDFLYQEYDFLGTIFEGLPLYLVKARNLKLQSLFTGQTENYHINWERLNRIKPGVSPRDINPLPHPFD